MLLKGFSQGGAVAAAVHRQGTAGGNGMLVCGPDHEGAEAAQFLLQQASGPITAEGAKAIAADQLGELAAVMGGERRTGLISTSRTGMPARAICQAASVPARPAPITKTDWGLD